MRLAPHPHRQEQAPGQNHVPSFRLTAIDTPQQQHITYVGYPTFGFLYLLGYGNLRGNSFQCRVTSFPTTACMISSGPRPATSCVATRTIKTPSFGPAWLSSRNQIETLPIVDWLH